MRRLICSAVVLGLAGYGGYKLYTTYYKDNSADKGAEDDYWAGLDFGITGWSPQLPIHPKSKAPTQGVYGPTSLYSRKYKPGDMIPARTMDYANPSQLVATTGPGNLAPMTGVNTEWVGLNDPANGPFQQRRAVLAMDSIGAVAPDSPLVVRGVGGNFVQDRSVITNG